MKRKLSCIVLSTALVVSLVAGAGGEDAMAAKKAKLGTKKMTLTQGKSKVIKVKNKKKGCRYTFSSSKKKVATVTKKGKVKAVAAGTAKITVKEVSKKAKKRKIGVVKVRVKKNSQTTVTPQTSVTPQASTVPQTSTTPGGTKVTPPNSSLAPTASPSIAPQESKEPTKGTKSVSVYLDEITEANKIAEVNGPGLDPTAAPTEAPAGEATPEPTPAVLVNATMEDDSTEPIEKRGDASVSIVEDGANGTGKSAKITDRSADWHGAAIDVTSFAETDNDYEITFYAKQSTGADSKIDLSMQYVNGSGETRYDGIKTFDLPNDTWTKCEAKMTIPEHNGQIIIYWQSVYNSSNFMDFCLDEVTISGVAKAAAGVDYPDLSLGLGKTSVSNPIMTSRLTADPYAMEYNGRIYVYGTNDSQQYEKTPDADNNYSKINTINVYSSAGQIMVRFR